MRISVISAAAVLALGTPLLADTMDQVVTIPSTNGEFVGSLMTPEGSPAPVVLLLHGFNGSRDELATDHVSEGIFVRTAARLAEAGYASLRIDFRGSGESTSDITYADTTFDGQVADAVAAMDYLKTLNTVDGRDIFVIGWSQGGLVATGAAGRSSIPDAVALWNAVADAPQTYGGLLGDDVLAAGIAAAPDETITATLPWGAEVMLDGAFFDGIESFDAAAEIGDYAGPYSWPVEPTTPPCFLPPPMGSSPHTRVPKSIG